MAPDTLLLLLIVTAPPVADRVSCPVAESELSLVRLKSPAVGERLMVVPLMEPVAEICTVTGPAVAADTVAALIAPLVEILSRPPLELAKVSVPALPFTVPLLVTVDASIVTEFATTPDVMATVLPAAVRLALPVAFNAAFICRVPAEAVRSACPALVMVAVPPTVSPAVLLIESLPTVLDNEPSAVREPILISSVWPLNVPPVATVSDLALEPLITTPLPP